MQLEAGSLMGIIRDMLGVEELSYLWADDEDLYREIVDAVAEVQYHNVKTALERGLRPDVAHFWEDICYKNGPLALSWSLAVISRAPITVFLWARSGRISNIIAKNSAKPLTLDR